MNCTSLLGFAAAIVLLVGVSGAGQSRSSTPAPRHDAGFQIVETSLADLRTALSGGRVTSHELVLRYLARIATYEPRLHAALAVNPHALEEADRLDRERAQGSVRGPLHGIPVALKDNIHTTSMPTTGGALAFAGYTPPYDATLTKNLIEAGAIVIAKTGLTELANWVAGAAIMLGALEGAAPDPNDAATRSCTPPPGRDYTKFLRADALNGARIGVPRAFYYDRITLPGESAPRGGLNPEQSRVMADAIAVLKQQGATVVDPADIPSFVDNDAQNNFVLWDFCSGADQAKGKDAACSVNFKYGMKRDFNLWLKSLGPGAPVKTLTELRQWNITHMKAGAIRYGQSRLDISDEMDVEADRARNDT